MIRSIAAACIFATTAMADPMDGLQNHYIQQTYIQQPCTAVISMIDAENADPNDLMNGIFSLIDGTLADAPMEEIMEKAQPMMDFMAENGNVAMAFGFLMGFEATHPNINGTHETVLQRLRSDCTADPSKTAMEYLLGYAAS